MELLFFGLVVLAPIASLWAIVRFGPVRNPWRIREHPIGFALFVGGFTFAIGYFGPLIWAPEANQGPLLGIFYTGPLGLAVGLVWGLVRAARRKRSPATGG